MINTDIYTEYNTRYSKSASFYHVMYIKSNMMCSTVPHVSPNIFKIFAYSCFF